MNLRDLKYLVAVVKHRHFGKAAQTSFVSQPALSMQLKKLEEDLGVQLFERTNKQVMVTEVGAKVAQISQHILTLVDEIRQLARVAQNPLVGDLRLGAFPTLAPYFLPYVVNKVRKAIPELRLLLREEKTDNLLQALRSGELDVALLALPIHDEQLTSISLFDDPFLLAVPEDHAFAKYQRITQAMLEEQQLLLLEEGHCLRDQALSVCNMLGSQESQDFRATSLETLRQMVIGGVGITLMPQIACHPQNGIRYIPLAKPAPKRTIGMVWRKQSARVECLQTILELLKK